MKKFNLFFIFIILFSLGSCHSDSSSPTEATADNTVKTGKVTGKVMSQNGAKAIGGASVFTFDDKYKIYYTTSMRMVILHWTLRSAITPFTFRPGMEAISVQKLLQL
jgi:hypothetical protein